MASVLHLPSTRLDLHGPSPDAAVRSLLETVLPSWASASTAPIAITRITGGITNALLRVDHPSATPRTALVRVFGAGSDVFIDRARDNEVFSRLAARGFGPPLFAVFSNGRVEGFIDSSRPLEPREMASRAPVDVATMLARAVAGQHALEGVEPSDAPHTPLLWGKLRAWADLAFPGSASRRAEMHARLDWLASVLPSSSNGNGAALLQALAAAGGGSDSGSESTAACAATSLCPSFAAPLCGPLDVPRVTTPELQARIDAAALAFRVVFAHNDVLSGNVLLVASGSDASALTHHLQLIDYEYAAPCYSGYDLANCWCEHCGFLPYNLEEGFPSLAQRSHFAVEYLAACGIAVPTAASYSTGAAGGVSTAADAVRAAFVTEFVSRCMAFVLASHMFWGLWAAIQAQEAEHDSDFDYSAYAEARLGAPGWGEHLRQLFPEVTHLR